MVTGLVGVAEARRATHVFIPHREVSGLKRLREGTLVDQILERLPEIEVHAVSERSRAT